MFRTLLLALFIVSATTLALAQTTPPNILLVMSDDQGYGDLGFNGNPIIRTPRLDQLASQSVVLKNFYVCPVCAPTRSSLMTGRYNYRTRVVDTYIGRAMMDTAEVTLAEMLSEAGYQTGIFGKWHLGDCYPMRPMDQGFSESLVHGGGGITQPGDYPGNTYYSPVLSHNGKFVQSDGYCSDVFTDGAIEFFAENQDKPFFAYVAYNAPHTPLQPPADELAIYEEMNFSATDFPDIGHPLDGPMDIDVTKKIYAMEENIDTNMGRMLDKLEQLGIADNTIVIFLTDNGPQQPRYNAGLHGKKGSVYEGGVHVPCFVRWPNRLKAGTEVSQALAHIDIAPTLLAACGVQPQELPAFDGRNALPLLLGEETDWATRTLYFQWHRGDAPTPLRAFSARGDRYKLVQAQNVQEADQPFEPHFQFYDLEKDPYEIHDLSAELPEQVEKFKQEYLAWFEDVSSTRGYDPPRIILGTTHETSTVLTRQDWRGPQANWGPNGVGYWEVTVAEPSKFD
ncbi:MAG: arylsulfatase, partial [Candidatus Omnitrophica bacterium]|nr:arylsulfatase [Candidatus Omnitrophota bacterium]